MKKSLLILSILAAFLFTSCATSQTCIHVTHKKVNGVKVKCIKQSKYKCGQKKQKSFKIF